MKLIKIWGVVLCLMLFLITSCKQQPVRLVFANKVNYEPYIIAVQKGYFKDSGLDVEVKLVTGGIQAAEALATGSADAGAMGDAPAVMLLSRNIPVDIVTRYAFGEHIHRLVVNFSIRHPKDLKGKRIGVQAGSSSHAGLLLWLNHVNLNPDDVKIIPLNPLDMSDAIKTGMIDAMAGSEPWPTRVMDYCPDQVHELADFSGLGHVFPHVLMVTKDFKKHHRHEMKILLQGLSKAVDFLNTYPDQAAGITSASIGLTLEQQKRCTGALTFSLGWDETDIWSMKTTAGFLKKFGKIDHEPESHQYPEKNKE